MKLARQIAAASLLLTIAAAQAGTFRVAPVRVDITAEARSGVLTIRNDAPDEPVVIQARTLAWSQRDGRDFTEPTTELLVNPPVFTIKPGGQQIVRVGLRNPARAADSARELSFRLLLAEVPQAAPADFRGIRVALNMTIPVFVAPAIVATADAMPELNVTRSADGQLTASAQNHDSKRFHITELALVDPRDDRTLAFNNEARYVLPGSAVAWRIASAPAAPTRYTLRVRSDRGTFNYEINEADGKATVQRVMPLKEAIRAP